MKQHQIDKIKIIMEHYGLEKQREIFIEECAEAIQAVQKYKRSLTEGGADQAFRDLQFEIADVLITAYQMKYFLNAEEIDKLVDFKIDRQIERIKEENKNEMFKITMISAAILCVLLMIVSKF